MDRETLLGKFKEVELPAGEYVVFGSCPLAVLRLRECRDIDLFVTQACYQQLKDAGWKEESLPEGGTHLVHDVFEAQSSWRYGDYNPNVNQLIKAADIIEGIPFVRLEEVLKWKSASGRDPAREEKDQRDIQLIEEYLAQARD